MRVMSRSFACLHALCAGLVVLCASSAHANVINIAVANGSFETVSVAGASNQLGYQTPNGGPVQNVANWTNNSNNGTIGYNFVFMSNSTTNANTGEYGNAYGNAGYLGLWGQNGITNSPSSGNFMVMDGAYQAATISQTLTGLTVGMDTKVYFYYAGAQQYGFTGPTSEGFTVSLTDATANTTESHSTAMLQNVNHGFTGWNYTYLDFTPTNTTETLSFLALGTPSGVPPMSLLDGISVVQVTPEPSSLALLGTGILSVGGMLRRRRATR